MMRLLFSPDPADGGGAPAPTTGSPAPAAPAPPPAASTVLAGVKSEREIALEKENENLRHTVKQREIEAAEATDKAHQLGQVAPKAKKEKLKLTFFDSDDD